MGAFLYIRPSGGSSYSPAEWPAKVLLAWRNITAKFWIGADKCVCCLLHEEQQWDNSMGAAQALLAQLDETGHGGAGLAATLFAARCAARLAKSGELHCVPPGQEAATLEPLPLSWLPDLPPTAVRDLHALRVFTIGQLAAVPDTVLTSVFGQQAAGWQKLARGADQPPSLHSAQPRSSPTVRYTLDTESRALTRDDVAPLFDELAAALALAGRAAAALRVSVGFADGSQSERAERIRKPAIGAEDLRAAAWPAVVRLLRARRRRPEWITVAATATTEALVQLPLPLPLAQDERDRQLHATVNALQARFGPQIIHFGVPRRRVDELRTPA